MISSSDGSYIIWFEEEPLGKKVIHAIVGVQDGELREKLLLKTRVEIINQIYVLGLTKLRFSAKMGVARIRYAGTVYLKNDRIPALHWIKD